MGLDLGNADYIGNDDDLDLGNGDDLDLGNQAIWLFSLLHKISLFAIEMLHLKS